MSLRLPFITGGVRKRPNPHGKPPPTPITLSQHLESLPSVACFTDSASVEGFALSLHTPVNRDRSFAGRIAAGLASFEIPPVFYGAAMALAVYALMHRLIFPADLASSEEAAHQGGVSVTPFSLTSFVSIAWLKAYRIRFHDTISQQSLTSPSTWTPLSDVRTKIMHQTRTCSLMVLAAFDVTQRCRIVTSPCTTSHISAVGLVPRAHHMANLTHWAQCH